jgi:hypothetical protein
MRILLVTTFLLSFSGSFYAQYLSLDWGTLLKTKSYPFSLSHTGKVVAIASDDTGNVYVASVFRDTVELIGPNPVTLVSNGLNDGLIAKFNSSGDCLWAFKIGGNGQDFCNVITVTSDNSIIVGGGFTNQVDFDPSANDSLCNTSNPYDLFFLKLTSSGDFQWVRTLKGSSNYFDCIHGIKENSNHQLVLTGEFSGTIDFDPGLSTYSMTGLGSVFFQYNDAFVATYSSNGDFVWVNRIGGTSAWDRAFDLDLDGGDNILVSGYFGSPSMDMDPSSDTSILHNTVTNNPYSDVFLAKYDVNGNHLWSGSFGGEFYDYGNTVDVAPNGEIVICGSISRSVDFDITSGTHLINAGNTYPAYIAKYSPSGVLSWIKLVNGLNIEEAAISEDGTIFLVGTFNDTVTFDGRTLISNGTNDCFAAELAVNGGLMWINSFGGPNSDVLYDINLISGNEIVVGGGFKSVIDIDPSSNYYEFIGESTLSNFFFAKYSIGDLGLTQETPENIVIYPNPNTGQFLNISSSEQIDFIELYDVFGKLLITSKCAQIDISHLQRGEYIVRVINSSKIVSSHKLIVCN